MINKLMKMLDIPFDEEQYEKNVIMKSDAIRDCLCKNTAISGAFSELSDENKQNVVNTFNAVQSVFDGLFGVKTRPYTAADFDGATVSVHTSTTGEPECKCENCECDEKKKDKTKYDALKEEFGKHAETVKNSAKKVYDTCKKSILEKDETKEESSLCDSLLDELQDNTDFEIVAGNIANRVVAVIKNKKDKKYTLTPETKNYAPTVKIDIMMSDVIWTSDRIYGIARDQQNWSEGPLENLVVERIKKVTGAPGAYVTYNQSGLLNIVIILKNKGLK